MLSIPQSINIRLPLFLAVLLIALSSIGLFWIHQQGNSLIEQNQMDRAVTTADTVISSLKNIMLTGRGDTAHNWLERISAQPSIDFARIYRPDGVEAFRDLNTVQAVNRFLAEPRFQRKPIAGTRHIDTAMQAAFNAAVQQQSRTDIRDDGHLTILYPIRAEEACLSCHGYTDNKLRGILMLEIPTTAASTRMQNLLTDSMLGFVFIILLFVAIAFGYFRRSIIHPLMQLNHAAHIIADGDLAYRIRSQRRDEFGIVADAFDHLVEHLERRIAAEAAQKQRQQLLTEAVISLSRKTAKEEILRHVGELAMEMVHARYAMVAYSDAKGERHLVPLGVNDEQAAAIGRKPQGEGLLGLFWTQHEPVRVDDIASHPESVGFPEGHPHMKSLLGVPIVFAGEVLGAIYMTDRGDDQPFSQDDEDAVTVLASACAIALSNLRNTQSELARINRRLHSREVELELMNEELTHANEAKSQFLANTSHELRTPLNAIIGFSELLKNPRMGELNAKQKRYVDHVHVSGKRLLTIINDLLDISKIEAGMMMIDEIPTLPGQVAQEVVLELAPLADSKHIRLKLENDCPDNEQVMLDAGKLHQIIVNLAGNAIKFTPEEGRVDICIRMNKERPAKQNVTVTVSDTGCGIALEDQEKIFEPFVQAKGGLNREHGGTGLGLALTRRQIHLLGGSIHLESEPGHGSCFTVTLPVESVDAIRDRSAEAHSITQDIVTHRDTEISEIIPSKAPRPKILVIDHNNQRAAAVVSLMEHAPTCSSSPRPCCRPCSTARWSPAGT